MSRRNKGSSGVFLPLFFLIIIVIIGIQYILKFVFDNILLFVVMAIIIIFIIEAVKIRNKYKRELLENILVDLHISTLDFYGDFYDDTIEVKSRQTFNFYNDIQYLKEKQVIDKVIDELNKKYKLKNEIEVFLMNNMYMPKSQYKFLYRELSKYKNKLITYKIKVIYIVNSGKIGEEKIVEINSIRANYLKNNPLEIMNKSDYNKYMKQKEKNELENKKREYYERIDKLIEYYNYSKSIMVVSNFIKQMNYIMETFVREKLVLLEKVNSVYSDDWAVLDNEIDKCDYNIKKIVSDDNMIKQYYESQDFYRIKELCNTMIQAKKEFNDYIEEKKNRINDLFGKRITREETIHESSYNYLRPYKKIIDPFVAEVSTQVFGSAENNPLEYVIKYFYPNEYQYDKYSKNLEELLNELESLRDAKKIIENYKQEYKQFILDVPYYVMANDEKGFYSRLGLITIDEDNINVCYKFSCTTPGGRKQNTFSVVMNEDNIIELIKILDNKQSKNSFERKQRSMMTKKLRESIKARDHYTCCNCGNSIYNEPNLLLEVDHIIPISKGGCSQKDNLQTLCWKCNRNKGAKLLEEMW